MGTVKRDFLNPEMIMMGSKDEYAMFRLEEFYKQICKYIFNDKFFFLCFHQSKLKLRVCF